MAIWRLHIACWVPKATNTLRPSNTYSVSTATMVVRTCLTVKLYVHLLLNLVVQYVK